MAIEGKCFGSDGNRFRPDGKCFSLEGKRLTLMGSVLAAMGNVWPLREVFLPLKGGVLAPDALLCDLRRMSRLVWVGKLC